MNSFHYTPWNTWCDYKRDEICACCCAKSLGLTFRICGWLLYEKLSFGGEIYWQRRLGKDFHLFSNWCNPGTTISGTDGMECEEQMNFPKDEGKVEINEETFNYIILIRFSYANNICT